MRVRSRILFLLYISVLPSLSRAQSQELSRRLEIKEELRAFYRDPVGVMDQRVQKRDAEGRVIGPLESRFTLEEISSGAYVTARDATRKRMCMEVDGKTRCLGNPEDIPPLSQIWGEDRVENLVDVGISARTLEALESRELKSAKLETHPWSDDYWAFYKGVLGARYGDPDRPRSKNWAVHRNYVQRETVASIINSGSQSAIDDLAPAEKYDLLVGDWNQTLTQAMWQLGANYYYNRGFVETWMGLCDGWSAASIMLPRPNEVVSLVAANGRTRLNFYPSDIKGLASLLWTFGNRSIRFVGGRCEDGKPQRDQNGRVVSQRCFDTNPGTFHLALTHQLGIAERSLIMDATYDYEVWNHPVYSYRYSYFNPQTLEATERLSDARISRQAYTRDAFRYYRASAARSFVGIAMEVVYMVETSPKQRETDSEEYDSYRKVRYLYDLELDSAGRIIGGEWYTNRHPDFLWVPLPGSHARSHFDANAWGNWNMRETLPQAWRNAAVNASSYSQPLGPIVEALLKY